MSNTLPSKQKFDSYVAMGLVDRRHHKELPLSIYCYSILANYERLWNAVTRQARGIVFDDKDRCIFRCIPKFFNDTEPYGMYDIDMTVKPVYYDKLDGSLIQVVNDPEYGLVVSSKGGFHSKQADWAREYIGEQYSPSVFEPGLTYAFELIHPENRIVIDYGQSFKLVLLAVIDIATGLEFNIHNDRFNVFERVSIVTDIEKHLSTDKIEGVVAKVGEQRYKIKTGEYVRLHRIVTDFTPKRVWESLRDGKSLEFQDMPEEFQQWLDNTIADVQGHFDAVRKIVEFEHERTKDLTPKELGLTPGVLYKGLVFNLRNGQDISEAIWKIVKPKEEAIT